MFDLQHLQHRIFVIGYFTKFTDEIQQIGFID